LSVVALLAAAAIEMPVSERRRRVRARLTPLGRERFAAHVAALQDLIVVGDP
jgi:hypothetical protein